MSELSLPMGLIIINKPLGITSQGVVNRVKKLLGADKAGHTGTLDPLATGVLPVLVGRAVKASEFMLTDDKHYGALMRLGLTSDTEDITGNTVKSECKIPQEQAVLSAIEQFVGKIRQVPPMYSALKVGGKKLCDRAREGSVIEREPREVTVYSIKAERINDTDYYIDVKCSKGTYIRTLCADIGKALGCGAIMAELKRLSASGFDISEAVTLDELEKMTDAQRLAQVLPTERIFEKYRVVKLPDFFARLAHSGLEIYLKKIGVAPDLGERVRLYDKNGFFAVGEVRLFDDGLAIKPIRQLD